MFRKLSISTKYKHDNITSSKCSTFVGKWIQKYPEYIGQRCRPVPAASLSDLCFFFGGSSMGNRTYLNRNTPLGNFRSSLSYEMASDNKAPFTHHQMSFNCWVIISRNEQMMFAISCEIDRPHPPTVFSKHEGLKVIFRAFHIHFNDVNVADENTDLASIATHAMIGVNPQKLQHTWKCQTSSVVNPQKKGLIAFVATWENINSVSKFRPTQNTQPW